MDDSSSAQLEQMRKELLAANEMAAAEQRRATELERTVTTREAELGELRSKRREREDELRELQRDAELELESVRRDAARELESVRRDAELDRYRTLEAERAKWEARELRALEQLETTRRELEKGGRVWVVGCTLIRAESQLQVAANELGQLQTEKDAVCLERERLRAEIALLQARLPATERMGHREETTGSGGAKGVSVPTVSVAMAPAGAETASGGAGGIPALTSAAVIASGGAGGIPAP